MKTSRFLGGAFFLFLGIILLGLNLEWWNIDIWNILIAFWPVILILIGLRMVMQNHIVFAVITVVVLAAIITLGKINPSIGAERLHLFDNKPLITDTFSEPLAPEIKSAKIRVDLGAIDLSIQGLASDSTDLYGGTSKLYKSLNALNIEKTLGVNNVKTIIFSESTHSTMMSGSQRSFDLSLTQKIPTELDINTGATNSQLDLRDLMITKLSIDSGASHENISLGRQTDSVETIINTGASKYTINVPNEYALYILSESGLVDNNFNELNLTKTENVYKSSDWDTNIKKMKFDIAAGVSKIDIVRY